MDYTDKYRLVVATPNSPTQVWSEADDEYLHNIVDSVVEQIGKENVKAFWLAGHSQGGMTSNRIVRTDYFKDKVDGWLSLSGGRLGNNPGRGNFTGLAAATGGGRPRWRAGRRPWPRRGRAHAAADRAAGQRVLLHLRNGPARDGREGPAGVSAWAAKLGCGPRSAPVEIADTKAGYVYDGSRQNPPVPAWGLLPAPGKARMLEYTGLQGRPRRRGRRPHRQGAYRRARAGRDRRTGEADAVGEGREDRGTVGERFEGSKDLRIKDLEGWDPRDQNEVIAQSADCAIMSTLIARPGARLALCAALVFAFFPIRPLRKVRTTCRP